LIPEIEEANIGHAIIAHSLFVGLERAVGQMLDLLNNPQFRPRYKNGMDL
jgi:pyridoxine 5'-phosphate synthase PdxJ